MNNSPFRLVVALDTNILAYLIDNTFPNLTQFIEMLNDSNIVDFRCSKFALYELIGIRKLEHYLRCLINETSKPGGEVNFSSALKYKNYFSAPELDYDTARQLIRTKVENDLKRVYNEFNITFLKATIEDNLWEAFVDLLLDTKISKEDALLFLTSYNLNEETSSRKLMFLTNDKELFKILSDDNTYPRIAPFGLPQYDIHPIDEIKLNGTNYNLTDNKTPLNKNQVNLTTKEFILEKLRLRFNDLFLGQVVRCTCSRANRERLLCINLHSGKTLKSDMFISIVSSVDYSVYNHPVKISRWEHEGTELHLPYTVQVGQSDYYVSVEITTSTGELLSPELMSKITAKNNLVFIHPDTD